MKRIKASELLKNLSYNSQRSFNDEYKHFNNVVDKIINEHPEINYNSLLDILRMQNEFTRLSTIKMILQTLVDNGFIENDIQVFNNRECDILHNLMIEKAVKEYKD